MITPALSSSLVATALAALGLACCGPLAGAEAITDLHHEAFYFTAAPVNEIQLAPHRNMLLIASGDTLTCCNLDLEKRWELVLGGPTLHGLATRDGMVYVSSGSELHAVDLNVGREVWKFTAAAPLLAPLPDLDWIYLVDEVGGFYRVNRDGMANRPVRRLPGRVTHPPVLSGGAVFYHVTDDTGGEYLVGIETRTTDERWRLDFEPLGCVVSSLAADDGSVCFLYQAADRWHDVRHPVMAACYSTAEVNRGGKQATTEFVGAWDGVAPRFGVVLDRRSRMVLFPLLQGEEQSLVVHFPLVMLPPSPRSPQSFIAANRDIADSFVKLWGNTLEHTQSLTEELRMGLRTRLRPWDVVHDAPSRTLPDWTSTTVTKLPLPGEAQENLLRHWTTQMRIAQENWEVTSARLERIEENFVDNVTKSKGWSDWINRDEAGQAADFGEIQVHMQRQLVGMAGLRPEESELDRADGKILVPPARVGTIVMDGATRIDNRLDLKATRWAMQGTLRSALVDFHDRPESRQDISVGPYGVRVEGVAMLLASGNLLQVHTLLPNQRGGTLQAQLRTAIDLTVDPLIGPQHQVYLAGRTDDRFVVAVYDVPFQPRKP